MATRVRLIGLFVGPIVLAIGWELLIAWVMPPNAPATVVARAGGKVEPDTLKFGTASDRQATVTSGIDTG